MICLDDPNVVDNSDEYYVFVCLLGKKFNSFMSAQIYNIMILLIKC